MNDEALLNFGKLSVKKTHDVAMAIVKARYGTAPRRFYFIGNSQGGHEALMRRRAIRQTTTASSPITRPTTSPCSISARSMRARRSTATAERDGSIPPRPGC